MSRNRTAALDVKLTARDHAARDFAALWITGSDEKPTEAAMVRALGLGYAFADLWLSMAGKGKS